jgi:hypothetical protein
MFWKIKDNGGLCCIFCSTFFPTEKHEREEELKRQQRKKSVKLTVSFKGNRNSPFQMK